MLLPPESLISFKGRRLAYPEVGYVNPGYSESPCDWLDRYAYMIPGDYTSPDDFLAQEKKFLAERYGGARIVTHGGGVRCGLDGDFSVKGLGCNPLMGRDSKNLDFAHSHGGLPLSGAIQEAIWGNVLHFALPFGAVRVAALILTGTHCVNRFRKKTPAALAVREAVLRPAHFERAVYFRPRADVPVPSDVKRVKKAIALLPDSLPMPPEISAGERVRLPSIEKLNLGLNELCKRFAAQVAVAVSRRFVHGALTASNIGLDGRWLDFGTTMAFSTYANAALGDGGFPPLWEEHLKCIPILQNLCFYINKYFPIEDKSGLPQPEILLQTFFGHYQDWLVRAFLNLTGFPEILWQTYIDREDTSRLATLLIDVATTGVKRPFISATPDWEKFGPNKLGDVLRVLALWYDHHSCDSRLECLVPDAVARNTLIKAYGNIAGKLIRLSSDSDVAPHALRRLIYCNAGKVSKNISAIEAGSVFGRYLLRENVSTEEIQPFIDATTDEARVLYQSSPAYESLLWKKGESQVSYDAGSDSWKVVRGQQTLFYPWEELEREELRPMRNYWGARLWTALYERENLIDEPPLEGDADG